MSYNPNCRGSQFNVSSRQLITNYTNGSATPIVQGTPVYVTNTGTIMPVDVTNESTVEAIVGYANTDIAGSASGPVISLGRLENFSTSFTAGNPVYIGLNGVLINQKPSAGVAGFVSGDFVVFAGVIVTNQTNPSALDLQVLTQIIGQL